MILYETVLFFLIGDFSDPEKGEIF
jgi:hypothetical protein